MLCDDVAKAYPTVVTRFIDMKNGIISQAIIITCETKRAKNTDITKRASHKHPALGSSLSASTSHLYRSMCMH